MTEDHDSSPSGKEGEHRREATTQPAAPATSAGGIFIAAGSILGAIAGGILGQPTLGFLAGLAIGGIVATGMWLSGR